MSDLNWLRSVELEIADLVTKHDRVGLMFSGGLESCLLLHLVKPWQQHIKIYTRSTGAEFPHMRLFIQRMLAPWDHQITTADLLGSFRELGLPSSVLPIEHTQGIAEHMQSPEKTPRITAWSLCCSRNRNLDWKVVCDDGVRAVINGQRSGDYGAINPKRPSAPKGEPDAAPLEIITPLWDIQRSQVHEAVEVLGIELPDHYTEYPDSLDCSLCPAALTTARRAWMAKRYPAHLRAAQELEDQIRQASVSQLDTDNTAKARDKQFG